MLRLNLGCGLQPIEGFTNIDREPAAKHDLLLDICGEAWPFADGSVDEIVAHHVLEHTDDLAWVMKECYRVMKPGALLRITSWHPASDQYWGDPTHRQPITKDTLSLFSLAAVNEAINAGKPITPLALYHEVNFEVVIVRNSIRPEWLAENYEQVDDSATFAVWIDSDVRTNNNVVDHVSFVLRRL